MSLRGRLKESPKRAFGRRLGVRRCGWKPRPEWMLSQDLIECRAGGSAKMDRIIGFLAPHGRDGPGILYKLRHITGNLVDVWLAGAVRQFEIGNLGDEPRLSYLILLDDEQDWDAIADCRKLHFPGDPSGSGYCGPAGRDHDIACVNAGRDFGLDFHLGQLTPTRAGQNLRHRERNVLDRKPVFLDRGDDFVIQRLIAPIAMADEDAELALLAGARLPIFKCRCRHTQPRALSRATLRRDGEGSALAGCCQAIGGALWLNRSFPKSTSLWRFTFHFAPNESCWSLPECVDRRSRARRISAETI